MSEISDEVLQCLHCDQMIECGGKWSREGVKNCLYGGTAGRTDEHIRMAEDPRSIDYGKIERYYKEYPKR